jgi:hypothetical protein
VGSLPGIATEAPTALAQQSLPGGGPIRYTLAYGVLARYVRIAFACVLHAERNRIEDTTEMVDA